MRILLVNVDSKFNLAIRRMYNYFKDDHEVEMIDLCLDGYPSKKFKSINALGYDEVYVSNIFDINQDKFEITMNDNVIIGGIGSVDPHRQLPKEIEQTKPFYFEHETTGYGFITRGCPNKCWFCKVPKFEGELKEYNTLESILEDGHKMIKFLDNNILAYDKHEEIFKKLIELKQRCEFNQGLDFRLITESNAELLSKLNYMGEYIFAFDQPQYKNQLEEKMVILKKHIPKKWKLKFYIYHNYNMKISDLIKRVEWCRENECLPYIMRDINCYESKQKNFLTDYAAYSNQPSFFKKLTFEDFLYKRHKKEDRIKESLRIYGINS